MFEKEAGDEQNGREKGGAAAWVDIRIPVVRPVSWSVYELREGMRELERVRRETEAAMALLVGATPESRDTAADLARSTGISNREAKRRKRVADVIRKVEGALEKLVSGSVSDEHIGALAPVADMAGAASLLHNAESASPEEFAHTVEKFRLSASCGEDMAKRQRARRALRFYAGPDGMIGLSGLLPPMEGTELKNRLAAIVDAQWRADHPDRAKTLGGHGGDTYEQRMADALLAMAGVTSNARENKTGSTNPESTRSDADELTNNVPNTGPTDSETDTETTHNVPSTGTTDSDANTETTHNVPNNDTTDSDANTETSHNTPNNDTTDSEAHTEDRHNLSNIAQESKADKVAVQDASSNDPTNSDATNVAVHNVLSNAQDSKANKVPVHNDSNATQDSVTDTETSHNASHNDTTDSETNKVTGHDASATGTSPPRVDEIANEGLEPAATEFASDRANERVRQFTQVKTGKPAVIIVFDIDKWEARIAGGGPIPITESLLDQARHDLYYCFKNTIGEVLKFARSRRDPTPVQRLALVVRDEHCLYPGCHTPPDRCDAHHTNEVVKDQGLTDVDVMGLFCKSHHRHIHLKDLIVIREPGGFVTIKNRKTGTIETQTAKPRRAA